MSKKSIITIIISMVFVFVFYIGHRSADFKIQTKAGLKVNGWSSGLGSISETDLDKTKFSYSINLTNENGKIIFIKSIQPLVNETIKSKVLSKEIVVNVDKEIKPNEAIEIKGEIIFDTKGLTKSDIVKFEPFITDIKVSTEETVSLK